MKINKTPQKRSLEGEHIMNEVTFFDSLFNDLIGNCAAPAGSIYYTANTPKFQFLMSQCFDNIYTIYNKFTSIRL